MNRPRCAVTESIDRLVCTASVLFLLIGVLIVSLNVASRYLLHLSLAWSAELARYAIVWSALLAASVLVSRRQHLTVDLPGFRSGRVRRLLDVVVAIGSMTFFLILAISGAVLVRNTTEQMSSSIGFLPMALVYSIVPLSAFLMWSATFANLLRMLRPDEDEPEENGTCREREET